ncbi:MAG: hypothetical protein H7A24_06660 [Leptospiraceae bacterium]|nr:hypothetical protein [Leptospiraceae bacterium]MCP5511543.1 hypothetical protein [Leptospiraceae bacterium]
MISKKYHSQCAGLSAIRSLDLNTLIHLLRIYSLILYCISVGAIVFTDALRLILWNPID